MDNEREFEDDDNNDDSFFETEVEDGEDEESEPESGYQEFPEFDFQTIDPAADHQVVIDGIEEKYGFTVTADYANDLIEFVRLFLHGDSDATSV